MYSVMAAYKDNSVHGDCAAPTFSLDWTAEEDALLQKGLLIYASESNNVMRYAKISALLNGKSIRDVALRRAWMNKKEASKRREADMDQRRTKDRKT